MIKIKRNHNIHKCYKKDNMPLRIYYSAESVKTLCLSCIISCLVVCTPVLMFYKGKFSIWIALIAAVIGLYLTMFIGGHIMLKKAKVIVDPIEEITKELEKVAKGDFSVQIEKSKEEIKIEELNTLIDHFNTMAKALNNMEYLSKDFMNSVSHEVKTPLAAIVGFTEILQDSSLEDAERREYLSLVNSEAVHLSRLCENMLRMSRLDNQVIVTNHEKVNISEQLRKSVILNSEKWSDKEQQIDINLKEYVIESDKDLIMQIWMNLIDNAMKYSDKESTIYISGEEDDNHVKIIIKDEGQGIQEEKLPHIFEKFYQCDESHKKQGNGLGLSIVKRIIELLHGSIECRSIEGQGTEMIVTLNK